MSFSEAWREAIPAMRGVLPPFSVADRKFIII